MDDTSTDEKTRKLWDMITAIKFGMMTSEDGETLRSRPMAASQKEFDGNLWFYTRASSHKVEEVDRDSRVNVSYADPAHQNYVSVSGTARLVRDPAAIKSHWSEAMRTWFPKGTDDPEIAMIRVHVEQAEYWDAPSSTMLHIYGYAKAVVTGQSPHPGDNAKLTLA